MLTPPQTELRGSCLPARLRDLPRPPERVFVAGTLPGGPAVAIVGTRQPSTDALDFAARLAGELAQAGVAVLSGGAIGIDTAAHQGALAAAGITVVVSPSSLDCPYPKSNARLFSQVVREGGALISDRERAEPAFNARFFVRNSYLAALCHAMVVVEAPYKSGARNAALWCRRLGRPLLVVPSAPWNLRGLGCIEELRLGAQPISSHRDVLRALATQNLHPVAVGASGEQLPLPVAAAAAAADRTRPQLAGSAGKTPVSDSCPVLGVLRRDGGPLHPDVVGERAKLGASAVQQRLLELALEGKVVRLPSGDYRLGCCPSAAD